MTGARLRQLVRQFPENGLKLLLENPANARDLLQLTEATEVRLIDFDRLTVARTTFVGRDYRHVEADVVLTAPVKRGAGSRSRRLITIYILIEHQSEPDLLMPLRVLEYVLQIFKAQVRDWSRARRSLANLRLRPVLPVVFYTGTRSWDALGNLVELVELGEHFARRTPGLEPLFLNLSAVPEAQLESKGGYLGQVLRLVQQRRARPEDFRQLLGRVVQRLEQMPAAERLRGLELLSYIQAFVYYEREPAEHRGLQETIEDSVRTDQHRREVVAMHRTIADELKAEGEKVGIKKGIQKGIKKGEVAGRQHALLLQLQKRFGSVPQEVITAIEATTDVAQLDAWLERVLSASTIQEMEISLRK